MCCAQYHVRRVMLSDVCCVTWSASRMCGHHWQIHSINTCMSYVNWCNPFNILQSAFVSPQGLPLCVWWRGWLVLQSYCQIVRLQSGLYIKALNFELFSVLKTSHNTVKFSLFSRLNGYFLHNNRWAFILHIYIMIQTRVESIFTLVICDNYTMNIIFRSKCRWGSNLRSMSEWYWNIITNIVGGGGGEGGEMFLVEILCVLCKQ